MILQYFKKKENKEQIIATKQYKEIIYESNIFLNKDSLISKLGMPSYVDPIENKFFYFTELSQKKSILKKKIKYSYVFVFK